ARWPKSWSGQRGCCGSWKRCRQPPAGWRGGGQRPSSWAACCLPFSFGRFLVGEHGNRQKIPPHHVPGQPTTTDQEWLRVLAGSGAGGTGQRRILTIVVS